MIESNHNRPMNKAEIATIWRGVSDQVASTFASFSQEDFSAERTGWSYAQNLDHLVRSTSAVTKALALPKLLLRTLFGKSSHSRTSDEVRSAYLAKLDQGSQAGGKFVPTGSQTQADLLAEWEQVSNQLITNLDRWNEQQLDQLRLPHPLLGKLTVREMLFFAEFHTRHHLDNCVKKQQEG
jgi:hypothetical protein